MMPMDRNGIFITCLFLILTAFACTRDAEKVELTEEDRERIRMETRQMMTPTEVILKRATI